MAHGYGFLRVWRSTGLIGLNDHSEYKNAEKTSTQNCRGVLTDGSGSIVKRKNTEEWRMTTCDQKKAAWASSQCWAWAK